MTRTASRTARRAASVVDAASHAAWARSWHLPAAPPRPLTAIEAMFQHDAAGERFLLDPLAPGNRVLRPPRVGRGAGAGAAGAAPDTTSP